MCEYKLHFPKAICIWNDFKPQQNLTQMKQYLVKFQEVQLSEISCSKKDIWGQDEFFTGALLIVLNIIGYCA